MAIRFYGAGNEFSNFYALPTEIDGKIWPTTEHYFQAQKFPDDPEYAEAIYNCGPPSNALAMGRSRPYRADWEDVKDNVMRRGVAAKFSQHKRLERLLLSTGDEEIVEDAPGDYHWGAGSDGSGLNMLGKILMEVRDALRNGNIATYQAGLR